MNIRNKACLAAAGSMLALTAAQATAQTIIPGDHQPSVLDIRTGDDGPNPLLTRVFGGVLVMRVEKKLIWKPVD